MLHEFCWNCGKQIPANEFFGQGRRFCTECEEQHVADYKAYLNEYLIAKNRIMFERALRYMEKAQCHMTRYKRFAKAVERHSAACPEQYRSSDEMIAAIVFLEAGYDFEMNHKVGSYVVDMFIPQMNVCVEIDGDRHQYRKKADCERDVEIRKRLGALWEVIRIPTEYIEKNPSKLVDAVKALYDLRKKEREKNGGILSEHYSQREKAAYADATQYIAKRIRAV